MAAETIGSKITRVIQRLILRRASKILFPSLKAFGFETLEILDTSNRNVLIGLRRFPPFPESFFIRVVPHGIVGRLNIEYGWFLDSIGYRSGFLHDTSVPIWIWRCRAGWASALGLITAQLLTRIAELAQDHARDELAKRELESMSQKPRRIKRSVIYEGDAISKLIADFESELPAEIDDYFAEFLAELGGQSW
jgi:hypothetical protein